ncbi:histidine triad nucleotide-binding protein [Thermoanaerobacterium saccharolyticum]|uniref:Histidine triad (HIT) protein n=2 Tax=Thermoanaerobacterium TaxID=28895 RepID=W9EAF9_9THEO|nr:MULTISPECIES: histidine triad nucleotide-binding protein [Thermoanaerobacterium]AFK87057.1 histidine triad (HIT) protein [Thermoanaerobacterium saccharolyticum JW/SL-YS485]ETO38977.1 histidine triad (HIT) protein [Thermoanaerobacterium aotearoense SCUT27]
MSDCIFCKIINREIESKIIYEDDYVVAFPDINPQAPVHLLIVPKAHIDSPLDIDDKNKELVGHVYVIAKKLAKQYGIDSKGYRIVSNCGDDGGQTVHHIHFHLLGGRFMTWPPG